MADYAHPEAHKALASYSLSRAFWLDQARFALKYSIIHDVTGLTPEQVAQRSAILTIAEQIISKARDKAMDNAVEHWRAARTWETETK
jgi:hypothetical protein